MVFVRPHMSAGEFLVGMPEFFVSYVFVELVYVNSVIRYVLYQFLLMASYHL